MHFMMHIQMLFIRTLLTQIFIEFLEYTAYEQSRNKTDDGETKKG